MTGRSSVTVSHRIHVNRPPEAVFDYTQDYETRSVWDPTVVSAKVVNQDPRRVEIDLRGIGPAVLEYQVYRRGERTTAAFNAVASKVFGGGGGSWSYEARDGGTEWVQTNTLEFKNSLMGRLLGPLIRRNMATLTRKSMAKAKAIMEAAATPGS